MRGFQEGALLLETPGIRVIQVAHEQLLAMKLGAWRDDTDIQDARRVLKEMNSESLDETWRRVEPFIMPGSELSGTRSRIFGRDCMELFEHLVNAAVRRESLELRELVMEFLNTTALLTSVKQPEFPDERSMVVATALLELFAERRKESPPEWTAHVLGTEPFFLLRSAETMPRLRALCLAESPEPLRKRGLYAPPNFLDAA